MKFNLNIKHNTVIFAVLMAFCVIAFVASAHSEETYIYIGTKAELEAFRDRVNNGETSLNAKLTADIDLQGSEENQWTPIGNSSVNNESPMYEGYFDGQGYKILGLYINKSNNYYQGFFGHINCATIKNLAIKGEVKGIAYVGGICGRASHIGSKQNVISNCINEVRVTGAKSDSVRRGTGGICGCAYVTTIANCVNLGGVDGVEDIGGICGSLNDGTMSNCINKEKINGQTATGGLCGTTGGSSQITNCINIGTVDGGDDTGGVCGKLDDDTITITNCVNEGNIKGGYYAGGICGGIYAYNAKTIVVRNCMSTGKILASMNYGGGIAGYCNAYFASAMFYIDKCGYVAGSAEKAIGIISGSGTTTVTDTKEYAENELPATAAIVSVPKQIAAGGTVSPTVSVYPVNAYNKNDVHATYTTSDKTVVYMTEDTKLIAVKEGKATITSKITGLFGNPDNITWDNEISVTGTIPVPITNITFNKTEMLLRGTDSEKLIVTFAPENPTISYLEWSSSNTSVATVDSTGKVTAVAEGNATITARAIDGSGKSASCVVTVKNDIKLSLNKTETLIRVGTNETLILTNTASKDEKGVEWSSSNENVATVDQNGKITAIARGTATITVKSKVLTDRTATCAVTVRDPIEAKISQETATITRKEGTALSVTVTKCDKDDSKEFIWSSSDEAVAKVDSKGLVTTYKVGSATIKATSKDNGNVSVACDLTVVFPTDKDGYSLLENREDFEWFRDEVNSGNTTINARLATDINLEGSEENQWNPIGSVENKAYKGVFDGQGHTISGLYIKSDTGYKALFGYISEATVKNLVVAGTVRGQYSAGVCARATSSNISGCENKVNITGGQNVGGICAYAYDTVFNSCVNSVKIEINMQDVSVCVGGICGCVESNMGMLQNCMNMGYICGYTSVYNGLGCVVGGICGKSGCSIYNSINRGEIYADGSCNSDKTSAYGSTYAGGIVGIGSVVSNSTNDGAVHSRVACRKDASCATYSGGIAGRGTIAINCINVGTVYGSCYREWKLDDSSSYSGYILGYAPDQASIYRSGSISGTASKAIGYKAGSMTKEDTRIYGSDQLPATSAIVSMSKNIAAGVSITPTITVYPTNAYNKTNVRIIRGASSDRSILYVKANGEVVGIKDGVATAGGEIAGLLGYGESERPSEVTFANEIKVTGTIEKYITQIKLNAETLSANIGQTKQLTATITPSDATVKVLEWTSSNPNVATVDGNGKITPVAEGSAMITAKAVDGSGVEAHCYVTVTDLINLFMNKTTTELREEETETLTVTNSATDPELQGLEWASSDEKVATVDQNGKITAVGKGTASIIAISKVDRRKNTKCTVTVKKKIVVTPYQSEITMRQEGHLILVATVTGEEEDDKTVKWVSGDSSIASIDETTGAITIHKDGTVVFTAISVADPSKTGTTTVTIKKNVAVGFKASSPNAMNFAGTQGLSNFVSFAGDATDTGAFTWVSSDESTATVSADGVVTGHKTGGVVITAVSVDDPTKTASIGIYVDNDDAIEIKDGWYQIKTAQNLAKFRDKANSGYTKDIDVEEKTYTVKTSGLKAILLANVKMSDAGITDWTPIGNDSVQYSGVFDGSGYTISALKINASSQYKGLFGYIKAAEIKNLTVAGSITVSGSDESGYGEKVGGICGYAYGESIISNCTSNVSITDSKQGGSRVGGICGEISLSKIVGCSNKATISSGSYVGGICGAVDEDSILENCTNGATVAGTSIIGGVCGYNNGHIKGCTNEGKTSAVKGTANVYAGGVCGWADSQATVSDSSNTSSIVATGENNSAAAGGVCGSVDSKSEIYSCTNSGQVTGNNNAGGICGRVDSSSKVSNCTNSGTVTASNDVTAYSSDDVYVGGICGWVSSSGVVANCLNGGSTTGTSANSYVGGICGWVSSYSTVRYCANLVKVVANGINNYAGGICGKITSNSTAKNCVNEGIINATTSSIQTTSGIAYAGGICGDIRENISIVNCVSKGNVASTVTTGGNAAAGGICGYASNFFGVTTITNCGYLSGTASQGIGEQEGDITVTPEIKVYNTTNTPAVTVIPATQTILTGSTNAVNVDKIYPSNAYNKTAVAIANVTSEDTTIVRVTGQNKILGVHEGNAQISYTASGLLGNPNDTMAKTVKVTGEITPITSITLNCEETEVIIGTPAQITATIAPAEATVKELDWTSSDTEIATVDNMGNVTGIKEGTVTITASAIDGSAVTATCTVAVKDQINLSFEKTETVIRIGASEKLTVINTATDPALQGIDWSSSNESIAKVDQNGNVTAIAKGNAVITATSKINPNKKATCNVEVRNPVSIEFKAAMPDKIDYIAATLDLNSCVVVSGDTGDSGNVTWSSSDDSVIKIDANGLMHTLKNGSAVITGKSVDDVNTTVSKTITVSQIVTGISVVSSTGEQTMLIRGALQLVADVTPKTSAIPDVQWTSSDETVATVDANGLVTAKEISGKSATVTITASAVDGSGVTGNIQLTVTRPDLTGISFAKKAYRVLAGNSQDLYAELNVAPEMALKPQATNITWSSDNSKITVDANGRVTMANDAENVTGTITAQCVNEKSQTVSCTATVTTEKVSVNLNLATKLEGRQSGGGTGTNVEQIEVWLYDNANHPLWNGSGTTDAQGKIRFEIDSSTVQAGQTVKLWIKGKLYLAKLLTQTVTLSGSDWNVTMPEKLKTADSNEDNKVNLTDFGILGNSFLKKKGVVGFDERADYNVDDKVNLTDFGFLGNNFLKKGDNKPQAAVTMLMTAAARKGSTDTAMEVLNTETAKIAEEALENSTATDEETQEEEILYAVQNATGAELKAENPATSSANSSSDSNSGSSSGGCNAGYGALALMFAIPLIFKKRK